MEMSIKTAKQQGAYVQGTISYTISPVHTIEKYVDFETVTEKKDSPFTYEEIPLIEKDDFTIQEENRNTAKNRVLFIEKNKDTDEEIFVIGGGMVYFETLPYAKKIYLTEVEAEASEVDSWFPEFDDSQYERTVIKEGQSNDLTYTIACYERR